VLRELHWLPVRQCVDLSGGPVTVWSGTVVSRCRHPIHLQQWLLVAVSSVQHLTGDESFPARRILSATSRTIRVEQASWVSKKRERQLQTI